MEWSEVKRRRTCSSRRALSSAAALASASATSAAAAAASAIAFSAAATQRPRHVAAAAERAGAAFLANLRRLVALHMQPVLPANLERLIELGGEGRRVGKGEVHGANDCFCDSLIQVAALAGLLPSAVGSDVEGRRRVSASVREALNADPERRRRQRRRW